MFDSSKKIDSWNPWRKTHPQTPVGSFLKNWASELRVAVKVITAVEKEPVPSQALRKWQRYTTVVGGWTNPFEKYKSN